MIDFRFDNVVAVTIYDKQSGRRCVDVTMQGTDDVVTFEDDADGIHEVEHIAASFNNALLFLKGEL